MDSLRDREGPLVRALRAATGLEPAAALSTLLPPASTPVVPSADVLRTEQQRSGPPASSGRHQNWSARAIAERAEPWPVPTATDAAAFHRDGNRTRWETAAFARQHRLTLATVAACCPAPNDVASEHVALDHVVDGVVLLCEQTSWCWPAHDDAATRGQVLADPDHPVLDLGAAGVAAQLAAIDALLADDLDAAFPGVRARIRREAERRIFTPFVQRRDWHWIGRAGSVHNWNPWIHGEVLIAALRLLDGPDDALRRADIVELCIRGLDVFLADLPVDGAVDEGADYWWNGACRALEAVLLVEDALGRPGELVARIPALVATVDFPRAMALDGEWSVSVADSCARSVVSLPWHSLHRAALATGNRHAAALAVSRARAEGQATDHRFDLARVVRSLADRSWLAALDDPASAPPPPLDELVWLPSIHLLVVRDRTPGATTSGPAFPGLTVTVKGGHNAENHNHLDVGSVSIASAGVPVVVDPGRATYSATTFGPDRYSEWQVGSDWHAVPRVAGAGQAIGRQAAATAVALLREPAAASRAESPVEGLSLDLAAAYPTSGLRSWTRTARLDRSGGSVVVSDTWEFGDDQPPGPTLLRWILAGTVEPIPGGLRVTPVAPAPALMVRWPKTCPGLLESRHLEDPILRSVWGATLTRLSIDVTAVSGCVLTATSEPATGGRDD